MVQNDGKVLGFSLPSRLPGREIREVTNLKTGSNSTECENAALARDQRDK